MEVNGFSAVPSGRIPRLDDNQPRCGWLISDCPCRDEHPRRHRVSENRERHRPDDRFAQHRRAQATPRPPHQGEGETAYAVRAAEDVMGRERDCARSTSRSAVIFYLAFLIKKRVEIY